VAAPAGPGTEEGAKRDVTQRIVVANHKGGAGKTVSCANIAGALAEAGQRVLAVDMDPQAQLAAALGAQDALTYGEDGTLLSTNIADLLAPDSRTRLQDAVLATPFAGLDFIPGSASLERVRHALQETPAVGLHALRRVLREESLRDAGLEYDWILIDTAPKLDMLLDNALIAAEHVLAVLAPEIQQAEPLTRLLGLVERVRESMHPRLNLLGVLFNKANYDWVATDEIPRLLADMGLPVLSTVIPMYARLAKSYGQGPVALTAPNSREAAVVRTATQEIIDRVAAALGQGVGS